MACPRPGEQCQEYYCGGNASGKCASGKNADIQEMIAEHDRMMRDKVIDEFVNRLHNKYFRTVLEAHFAIEEVAKEMKEVKNGI